MAPSKKGGPPDQVEETAERSRRLADAIASLPAPLARVVVLHYLDGLNYVEIAAALDVPVSTVEGRLFKSRQRLRTELLAARPPRGVVACGPPAPAALSSRAVHSNGGSKKKTRESLEAPPDQRSTEQRHIRVEVDFEPLVDEAYAFVTPRLRARARSKTLAHAGTAGFRRTCSSEWYWTA